MHLQREAIRDAFAAALEKPGEERNIGLLFARALPEWPDKATKRGEDFAKFLQALARHQMPESYRLAYQRWQRLHADPLIAAQWESRLDTRLFTGLGAPHALETCLSFSRPWGLPLLPGSALKGLTRAHALRRGLDPKALEILFGRAPDGDGDEGEGGYLIFHDAWWTPGSADTPLAPEVVTVHHAGYYGSAGEKPATDFDSPNPNAQLAARGGFLFVIEGDGAWTKFAMELLKEALAWSGAGGKTAAGYGYFEAGLVAVGKARAESVIATGTETWIGALIEWDGGSARLTAQHPEDTKRRAFVIGAEAKAMHAELGTGQLKKLKSRQLRRNVEVDVQGNQRTLKRWAPDSPQS